MALYNLIGRRRCSAVSRKLRANILLLHFERLVKIFRQGSDETNVNISNELNFADVYRSVNYSGSLSKLTRASSGFIQFAQPLKNEIHSLYKQIRSFKLWLKDK